MKINVLSKLSGVHTETIRMYRKKGYLKPRQEENGYYEYTDEDAVILFELRKLRDVQMPLNTIEEYCTASSPDHLVELFESQANTLEEEIKELQREIRFINLEKRHVEECMSLGNRVVEMQSIDEKIDIYRLEEREENVLAGLYSMTTPTILVKRDILNGPVEDKKIPIQAGLGSYRYIFEENHITPPKDAVHIPNGKSLSMMITLENLEEMNLEDIAPMMNYAKEHGYTFLSDTTGYLACFEMHEGKPVFHYRVRACVEVNDIIDPDTL